MIREIVLANVVACAIQDDVEDEVDVCRRKEWFSVSDRFPGGTYMS